MIAALRENISLWEGPHRKLKGELLPRDPMKENENG